MNYLKQIQVIFKTRKCKIITINKWQDKNKSGHITDKSYSKDTKCFGQQ